MTTTSATYKKTAHIQSCPRMAGGEKVTPDGLIAVGQIAKEYGLYQTYRWSACRMFGAQVHQLPEIWEKLIAAGFESGRCLR